MSFANVEVLENKGNLALRQLRKTRLGKGLHFMLNSQNLPGNQCYLEYPDGKIVLASIAASHEREFLIIRELTVSEKNALLRKFQFV